MEAAVEDDHRRAAGRVAGDLDGVLDRLCAAVQKDRLLLLAAARRELGETPADLHVGLVRPDHEALVEVAVDLLVNRLPDRRVPVPEVEAADAAREVEVLAAVRVPDERALGAGDDERGRRDAPGDVLLSRPADPLELAAFLQGHWRPTLHRRGRRRASRSAASSHPAEQAMDRCRIDERAKSGLKIGGKMPKKEACVNHSEVFS